MFNRLICTLLAALFTLISAETFSNDDIVFIVNVANPATEASLKEINDYFFKRKRAWPDGTSVRFIDQKSPAVRNLFLKTVLNKKPAEVDRFWIGQKLYSGDSAPMQSPSDSLTIQFVGAFKGAIGYLSRSTLIDNKDVKILKITK